MTLPPRNFMKKGRDNRLRSPLHRKFVGQHLCVAHASGDCAGKIDCCHCRDIAPNGHGGAKPDDLWCVSLCRYHHRLSEKNEEAWGRANGIDFRALCLEFALASPDKRINEAANAYLGIH